MGHLRLITNNPTQGDKDGTVTPIPTTTIPINAIVNTGEANHSLVKVALRCDEGYMTTGDWEVSFIGTTANNWSVADGAFYPTEELAETATYTDSLTLNNVISNRNRVLWLKASTDGVEGNVVDTSVSLRVWGRTVPSGGA
jgi:hypothetical protein